MATSTNEFMARRSHQDVFGELVTGFQHLVLHEDIELGKKIGMGGYADVYEATLQLFKPIPSTNLAVNKVAVKVFRVFLSKEEDFAKVCLYCLVHSVIVTVIFYMQMFKRELRIWAGLQHENILPLIGVVSVDGSPSLASEWMQNGTMGDYLKKHENANIHKLVRVAVSCCKRGLTNAFIQV